MDGSVELSATASVDDTGGSAGLEGGCSGATVASEIACDGPFMEAVRLLTGLGLLV